LVYFKAAMERLEMRRDDLSDLLQKYTEPEQFRLLSKVSVIQTSNQERRQIGERLAEISDQRTGVGLRVDGLPDILWLPMDGGEIEIEHETFKIEPFFIAKYLVTYIQFQAFVDSDNGHEMWMWWREMRDWYGKQQLAEQHAKSLNNPRDSITWYQAVAFSNWLTAQYRGEEVVHPSGKQFKIGIDAVIRLPLASEWQWAAQGEGERRHYLWGEWRDRCANNSETGLGRAIGVGMYPQGAAKCGALDMVGNFWEWCLDDGGNDYINAEIKTLHGGAFDTQYFFATSTYRSSDFPHFKQNSFGMRVIVSHPVR
jgi:formylglycine-generating enzyme required for sulfatase activity